MVCPRCKEEKLERAELNGEYFEYLEWQADQKTLFI